MGDSDSGSDRGRLFRAAASGNLRRVEVVLGSSVDVNSHPVLYAASLNGYSEIVRMLLNAAADTEKRDYDYGRTPLHVASQHGFSEIVRMLLDAGADTEKRDYDQGRTPLHAASRYGYSEIVRII